MRKYLIAISCFIVLFHLAGCGVTVQALRNQYENKPLHKAFATGRDRNGNEVAGCSWGFSTDEQAKSCALMECRKIGNDCKVVDVNGSPPSLQKYYNKPAKSKSVEDSSLKVSTDESKGEKWLAQDTLVTKSEAFVYPHAFLGLHLICTIPEGTPVKIIEIKEDNTDPLTWYKIEVHIKDREYIGWAAETFFVTMAEWEKLKQEKQKEQDNFRQQIKNLEAKAKSIPVSNYEANLKIYKRLSKLDPLNKRYEKKVNFYSHKIELNREKRRKEKERKRKEKQREMVSMGYALQLLNWSWNSEHGYAIAKGEVKNITSKRLKNVEALVTWYNKNGDFITSDSALIEYHVLMPGQTSPFKVMERFNPQMNKASIEFKFLFGSKIQFYKRYEKGTGLNK